MSDSSPSLLDLMTLWVQENAPELHFVGNALCDKQNWMLGAVDADKFGWSGWSEEAVEVYFSVAADPDFFEKVKAGIEVAKASKVRLYLATNMEMTPPSFSLAK